jgi:succinoglycan biosynthesis protein ExoA
MCKLPAPHVSIIVPCRNESSYVDAFLGSVLGQTYADFEIIVADGLSDDDTRERLQRCQGKDHRLIVIDNPGRHVSKGLNLAIRIARGEIVIRMDVHTHYAEDYVEQCIEALRCSRAANVGGPARTRARGYLQKAISVAYHSPFAVGGARFHDVNYEGYVDTVTYGCWCKETLLQIGLFDEELIRNQDDELNLRLIRAGMRIWQTPKIRSWYYPRPSLGALFRQYSQYGYWKVRVIQKHRLPASFRHLVPGMFVGSVVLLAMLTAIHPLNGILLLVLLLAYGAAALLASLVSCAREQQWAILPILPTVFVAYHVGYGLGFLRGIIDFALLRRSSAGFSVLTRK